MENEKVKEGLHICITESSDCTRCSYHEYGYPDSCHFHLTKDAFTAIEQLMAQVKDKDCLIQQQADEIERVRRDVKKQQDKMFELAKGLPKHGEYIKVADHVYRCSLCNDHRRYPSNYCPKCGAKMEDVK